MSRDDMVWRNPAPDASAPTVPSGKYGTVMISSGPRIPTVIPNPLDQHFKAIREAYQTLDAQHSLSGVIIAGLRQEIAALTAKASEYQKRYEDAEARLEKIKAHL